MIFNGRRQGDAIGISKRIHLNFLLQFEKVFDQVHFYGPSEIDPNRSPLRYQSSLSIKKIVKYYSPDVIFVFSYFCCSSCLPRGFSEYKKIPKICIEVDYWNVRHKSWYSRNNFDFIIQRGYYNTSIIESVWLPFSCAEDIIRNRKPIEEKIHKIGFVGRGFKYKGNPKYYPFRRKAIKSLSDQNLIQVVGAVGHNRYPREIAKYFCYLSDTGRVKSPPAKTFEIMGAGSVLLTTPFHGAFRLFDEKEVCVYYTLSGVKNVAKRLLSFSKDRVKEIVSNATEEIDSKHLDVHRLEELEYITSTYIAKKRIPRKWLV